MECKKRSKSSGWECCYANKIFGTFVVEMRAGGQKLVKFCTHTDTHTHAAKLVVRIVFCKSYFSQLLSWINISRGVTGELRCMIHYCFQFCVNWWKVAFAGVDKILSGKYFPQNVIAFTVLTEELLRKHVETCQEPC